MMHGQRQLLFISLLILGISTGHAQRWFSHEIGFVAGPIVFQSDFGERHDFKSEAGNTGIGIGFVHYMNFDYRPGGSVKYSYFNDHFRVRSEFSWNTTNLKHFGIWVDENRTGEAVKKLRAHKGKATNTNIGMQLEYFPFSVKEFSYAVNSFAPYISLGVQYTLFTPSVYTTYGDGSSNNLENFYDPWYLYPDGTVRDTNFITTSAGSTLSVVGSIGTRFKLTRVTDLLLDLRWQHYFNDRVDGLNHSLASNKNNDQLLWLNFGYIIYLN